MPWIGRNWFELLQSAAVVSSLLFTATALRADTKARRLGNLFEITHYHRDIWSHLFRQPELARVLNLAPDLTRQPIKVEEELLVGLVILHLSSVYHAINERLIVKPEGVHKDAGWFFSLPIPNEVWQRRRSLQDRGFVEFVEAALVQHRDTPKS